MPSNFYQFLLLMQEIGLNYLNLTGELIGVQYPQHTLYTAFLLYYYKLFKAETEIAIKNGINYNSTAFFLPQVLFSSDVLWTFMHSNLSRFRSDGLPNTDAQVLLF
jgi:hypothetical protein